MLGDSDTSLLCKYERFEVEEVQLGIWMQRATCFFVTTVIFFPSPNMGSCMKCLIEYWRYQQELFSISKVL